MMEHAKSFSLFLVVGILATLLTNWLQSTFIFDFLSANLITLLIALVAINTTTLSVVLTKIREITDKIGGNFSNTAKEMKVSITEQVILIIVTAITQVMAGSPLVTSSFPSMHFVSSVILIGVFSYSLYILYDTANSVFVILQFENSISKDKNGK